MKVFITGSQSFIGKELIKQCENQNSIEVSGIDLSEQNSSSTFYNGDVRDKKIVEMIPEEVDAIIHLAALSSSPECTNNAYNCFDVNVMGTLNLIEAAKAKKAKQFILASSEWVYDNFDNIGSLKTENDIIDIKNLTSEYALSKLVSEMNLKQQYQHGFCPVTILRFGIVYGPRAQGWSAVESVLNTVAIKDEVRVGSIKTGRHFIHVSDIASAIIASIGLNGFEVLNIQSDKIITLGDIIESSQKILEKNNIVVENEPEDPNIRPVSNKKAKKMLNWSPQMTLRQGLESVIDFLKLK